MRNIFRPRPVGGEYPCMHELFNFKLCGYRVSSKGWHWSSLFPLEYQHRRVGNSIIVNVPVGRYFELDLIIRKEKDYA